MSIKIGVVMDPISQVNVKKDSSMAMMLEAQARGYEIYYMEMQDLYLEQGVCRATTAKVKVFNDPEHWYELDEQEDINVADLDAVLMRKDPPFDTEFIYATYMLERAEIAGTLIVNKPQSLRDCNEKLFTAWFPELTPKTLAAIHPEKVAFPAARVLIGIQWLLTPFVWFVNTIANALLKSMKPMTH